MISREFRISNKLGLHARPSAQLTQVAGKFASEIYIAKGSRRVNAKSIMGVMIDAEGPDEEQALDAVGALITSRFGEHE
jgi:phosphocarrier protein HPr